jgi:hypothetical protein
VKSLEKCVINTGKNQNKFFLENIYISVTGEDVMGGKVGESIRMRKRSK